MIHMASTASLLMLSFLALALSGCLPAAPTTPPVLIPGLRPASVVLSIPARSDTANVLLYLPTAHDDGQLWPTVLYLHGGSHRGTDLEKLMAYGPTRLVAEGRDLPFILIAPQLPEGEIWSDADMLMRLVDELSEQYPTDPDRLYVTGMSMGGRGAWYLAYRYPERIAAIVPVAAFQPITYWATSGRLHSIPVRAYHGDQDNVAPFADAVRMHEALRAVGGRSELKVVSGRDHFIADIFEDPDLYEWLLQQRRIPSGARTLSP